MHHTFSEPVLRYSLDEACGENMVRLVAETAEGPERIAMGSEEAMLALAARLTKHGGRTINEARRGAYLWWARP